ncbi:SpoIIE family protein phosphatase [Streptomyces sp. NPDC008317]|uniref:SpoIIE family protein phosphatase n=1 Tax=Streptomyces sp. NPDC008317 TaxID=3364827 RepID=UPI0036E76249
MTTPGSPGLADCEDVAWFRDRLDAARGAAAALGRRIGLGDQRTAELVLAVSELAANITKHAVDGSLLLRVLRSHAESAGNVVAGVEVIAVDSGPGMADVSAALRDGMSTAGTLGIGLGAVQRLADTFDIHSQPGVGTVQLARFWPRSAAPATAGEPAVGGITRPISGEQSCGDAWAARMDARTTAPRGQAPTAPDQAAGAPPSWSDLTSPRPTAVSAADAGLRAGPWPSSGGRPASAHRSGRPASAHGGGRPAPLHGGGRPASAHGGGRPAPVRGAVPGPGEGLLVMSCDGLGHGPLAALAAQAAVQAFRTGSGHTPEQVMEEVHRALRGTRGAAVAVARLEPDGRVLFCGVGNITAVLLTRTTRTTLLSHPGIVGHQTHQLRTHEYRMPAQGALVMHSDGLSERWKGADLAGMLHHPPAVIATGLLRLAATRRDDASAVIAKAAQ